MTDVKKCAASSAVRELQIKITVRPSLRAHHFGRKEKPR